LVFKRLEFEFGRLLRKSTTEGCFYVGGNLTVWISKKQNSISLSTTKAEYIAAAVVTHNFFG
jgi:hypothetical protein